VAAETFLVQNAVTAASHAILKNLLFLPIGVEAGACAAIDSAETGGLVDFASITDGACCGTHSGANGGTLAHALGNDDFFRVDLTLVPVFREPVGIDAFGVDDRVGVRCAARDH